ncbi:MAG TPA: hypothetical protein ENF55_01130 [Thermoprotei archaeon]|nr:hypothetical protein [Thermoprotei archaeon]
MSSRKPTVRDALLKFPEPHRSSYLYEYQDLLLHIAIVLGYLEDCRLPENFFDHHLSDIFRRVESLQKAAVQLDRMGYVEEARVLYRSVEDNYEHFKKKFRELFEKCVNEKKECKVFR